MDCQGNTKKMKSPRIKIISEDKKHIRIMVYLRDDDMQWQWVELEIKKDKLTIV